MLPSRKRNLTMCTGAAMSTCNQLPGKSNPIWDPKRQKKDMKDVRKSRAWEKEKVFFHYGKRTHDLQNTGWALSPLSYVNSW